MTENHESRIPGSAPGGEAHGERGDAREPVRAAVVFTEVPEGLVAETLDLIVAAGWLPERGVFRKRVNEDLTVDQAEDELRAIFGEYWVEGRTA